MEFRVPRETRICESPNCENVFECMVTSIKRFCTQQCIPGRPPRKRERRVCAAPGCDITFVCMVHHSKKYCCPGHTSRGKTRTKKQNRANSKKIKALWQNSEYRLKQLKARLWNSQNKTEKALEIFIQQILPNEYKFVGDGEFILAGLCPDFVNINGQKKIIEMFGDYWHGEKRTGIPNEQHAQDKIDIFSKHNYQTLIIWEKELKDMCKLKHKIVFFNEKKNE